MAAPPHAVRVPLGSLDLAALARSLRNRVPSCQAAALVGSAVAGHENAIGDLDITGFDPSVPPGEDRTHEFEDQGWPVHVVLYPPSQFLVAAQHPQLTLLFLREIRKLLDGRLLFDDTGEFSSSLPVLRDLRPPLDLLSPVADAVLSFDWSLAPCRKERLGFLHAVENLAFVWMHLELRYRYSKPKWLMADARRVDSPVLYDFLRAVALELVSHHSPVLLARRLEPFVAARQELLTDRLARGHLGDARELQDVARYEESVWPLRMCAYAVCQGWSESSNVEYRDLRCTEALLEMRERPVLAEVLVDLLLLDCPVPTELREAWTTCRSEFKTAWQRARDQRSEGFP